jgi:two-component system response regulator YesN
MKAKSVYKRRLYRIFLVIAVLLGLMLAVLTFSIIYANLKSDYLSSLSGVTKEVESNSQRSMAVMSKAVNEAMKDPVLNQFGHSIDKAHFYFNAIKLSEKLKSITTDMTMVDYSLGITMLYPPRFQDDEETDTIIFPEDSMSSKQFFAQLFPGQNERSLIYDHFKYNRKPVLVPVYGKGGALSSFLYITMAENDRIPYLFILKFPKETLIKNPSAEHFIIYGNDGLVAADTDLNAAADQSTAAAENAVTGRKTDKPVFPYEELYRKISSGKISRDHFSFHRSQIFLSEISYAGIRLAYVYRDFSLGASPLLIFAFIVAGLQALTLLSVVLLIKKLYQPIREIIADIAPGEDFTKPVDEFQLIHKNNEKIKTLGLSLHQALQENSRLASQKAVLDLLFLSNAAPAESSASGSLGFINTDGYFSTAIFEFDSSDDAVTGGNADYLKNLVHDFSLQNKCLHYANTEHNKCTLIIELEAIKDVKALIFSVLKELEESVDEQLYLEPRVALSEIHRGISSLHICYRESQKVLEYRHLYGKVKLISYEQISLLDANNCSYPLSVENKLIQLSIDGKRENVNIFDDVIRENIRDKELPKETLQSLIYALIGSLNRIFQELKKSPEELIGHSIDFKKLYSNWSDAATVSTLRNSLMEISNAVRCQNETSDKRLLDDMIRYIYENYSDDIMLNDMADRFNISPKYCGILFKELSDQNFKDFLNRYRIEKAKEFLGKNPDMKIQDLSQMVGFNSSNSFARVFSKYTGLTPTAYAERMNKN